MIVVRLRIKIMMMLPLTFAFALQSDRVPSPADLVARIKSAYSKIHSLRETVTIRDVAVGPAMPKPSRKVLGRSSFSLSTDGRIRFTFIDYEQKKKTTITGSTTGRLRAHSTSFGGQVRFRTRKDAADWASWTQDEWPFTFYTPLLKKGDTAFDGNWDTVTAESVDGRPCYRLYKDEARWLYIIWVDAKTYRVVKARQKWERKFDGDQVYIFSRS
jgi:hypothetical protein